MVPADLKFLFTVLYKDGTTFQQNPDDISEVDPARSCFTDATTKIENGQFVVDNDGQPVSRMDEIHRFLLQGETDSYMVDLTTGHFEVNCVPFRVHDVEAEHFNRRLIFFRRHYHHIQIGAGPLAQPSEAVVYRLGWQANLANGRNVQHVLEFE